MKLVLVRHGESIWNLENRFTGWTDVGLSEKGVTEALEAGKLLKKKGFTFDIAYTSVLKRANDTLNYILEELDEKDIPIKYSWRLNERHYGALQGLNKDETKKKYGEEQVHLWRRSAKVRPPELDVTDPRYPGNDPKYQDLAEKDLPKTENLLDTVERVIKYWNSDIKKDLLDNKRIIIVAHGNSLRGLMKYLDNIQHGINDIIHPVGTDVNPFRPWSDLPTVEEMEEGVEDIYVKPAKAMGLKVWSGTLLPIYGWRTYNEEREQMRQAFNEWLRTSPIFDGCIDFDAAVRGTDNPKAFADGYDSGDHLHPSERAYEAMGQLAAKSFMV